jgi:hypothetical protein
VLVFGIIGVNAVILTRRDVVRPLLTFYSDAELRRMGPQALASDTSILELRKAGSSQSLTRPIDVCR